MSFKGTPWESGEGKLPIDFPFAHVCQLPSMGPQSILE